MASNSLTVSASSSLPSNTWTSKIRPRDFNVRSTQIMIPRLTSTYDTSTSTIGIGTSISEQVQIQHRANKVYCQARNECVQKETAVGRLRGPRRKGLGNGLELEVEPQRDLELAMVVVLARHFHEGGQVG